jgi:hypothetical protein
MDLDPRLDEMRAHRAFRDLQLERPVGDAIVIADLPLLLDAQDLVEVDAGNGREGQALAVFLVSGASSAETSVRSPEQLNRLLLIELRRFPAVQNVQKHRHAPRLSGLRPAHPAPPKRARPTGQIVRYLNRTDRALPTARTTISCRKSEIRLGLPHEESCASA